MSRLSPWHGFCLQGSGSAQLSLERLAVQLLAIEEVSQLLHKVRTVPLLTSLTKPACLLINFQICMLMLRGLNPGCLRLANHGQLVYRVGSESLCLCAALPHSCCRQRQDDCRKCHALLHDKGATHYAAHNYAPAVDLLTPAVFFATSLTAGKSARLLAMALLKSHQPGRAADYVGLAEQQEGSVSTTGCIIRLQAALRLQAQACNRDNALPAASAAEQGPVLAAVRALGTVSELPSEAFQVS